MQYDFSDTTRAVLQTSGRLAVQYKYESIEPEHLLLALIDESLKNSSSNKVVLAVFKHLGINLFNLIEDIEESFDRSRSAEVGNAIPFSKRTEFILKLTAPEAKKLFSDEIYTEHILLSYVRCQSAFFEAVLKPKYNLDYQDVKAAVALFV